MRQSKNSFRHESIQDEESIQQLLKAVSKGIARGNLSFSDEDGEIVLEPEGLLNLKITATQDETLNKLNLRISWHSREQKQSKKQLKVNVDD